MNRRLVTVLSTGLGIGLAVASTAQANDRFSRDGFNGNRFNDARITRAHREPVQLRVKLRLNGHGSVGLRRLISREHNIDTRGYDLRTVSVRSKQRRNACAELFIGQRSTGLRNLHEGVTRFDAPRVRGDAPWTLQVADARVREVRVVLVPKERRHFTQRDDRLNRSGFALNNSGRNGFTQPRVTTRRLGSRSFR